MLTFSSCEEIQDGRPLTFRGWFHKAGGLKTSVSVPVRYWSFSVGEFCQRVVTVRHHSSASLGATVLSSLRTR